MVNLIQAKRPPEGHDFWVSYTLNHLVKYLPVLDVLFYECFTFCWNKYLNLFHDQKGMDRKSIDVCWFNSVYLKASQWIKLLLHSLGKTWMALCTDG